MNLIDTVAAFKYARVMCLVTVEALRIFPFLDNDVTIGSFVIELPQYIAGAGAGAATQDVVIQREGKKVEWWRVYEEGLPINRPFSSSSSPQSLFQSESKCEIFVTVISSNFNMKEN